MNSNTGYIMTVANSIIGVGILAMPFCFMKCGILLSILLLIISNLVTRIACHYLLKTSIKARRKNFEFLASHIFGSSGKFMVELCVIGYLMGTCITYFVVVGDLGPQIIAKLFSINHTNSLRTFVMAIVTVFCIIPLALLKNIESLSSVCISSIIFYFCLVLKIFFESENKITSSDWYENVYWWRPSGVTQCLPIFSMAFSCQMQVFEVYEALPNRTLEKMNEIIKFGTAICTGVYILVGFFGYVAFSDQLISGNVLISLSPSLASDIIKMGFVISVAVSFPLVIFPCRASLYSLLYHRSHLDAAHYIPEHRFKYITISLVLIGLIIGILIPSIELVIGLVGSTIGVAICIMFPASCFIKTNKKNSTEKLTAQFLLVFGFLVMILGTYANLGAIDEQQSGTGIIQLERKPDTLPSFLPNVPDAGNPISNQDMDQKSSTKVKPFKRKPNVKSSKSETNIQMEAPIRELQLDADEIKKSKPVEPILPKPAEPILPKPENLLPNAMMKQSKTIENPNVKPKTIQKTSELAINNDAIQKEDQEIAIDANEQNKENIKRTKEMLAEVKDELAKKSPAVPELVLEKIDKISQQVNNIEQMQKNELNKDAEMKKVIENDKKIEDNKENKDKNGNLNAVLQTNESKKIKTTNAADPVLKLLDKSMKLNIPQTDESLKGPPKEMNPIKEPARGEIEKESKTIDGANIGRDLLSENIVNNKQPQSDDRQFHR